MSVRTFDCVLMAAASTQKAHSSATATQDTSAHRRAATVKVQITTKNFYFHPLGMG